MTKNIIEIKNLNFGYIKSENQFENFNLCIPENSIYGFLGPNGAGKSTLIRLIVDLIKPRDGSISIMGTTLKKDRTRLFKNIGTLIEAPSIYNHLSGEENLKITQEYKGYKNAEEINEIFDVIGLTASKRKKARSYSLGMKQRLGIGMALLGKPKILILDEPINGLDPQGIADIRALIKRINKEWNTTIFISSHVLSEIEETCTHLAIIHNGKLLFDGPTHHLSNFINTDLSVSINALNPIVVQHILQKMGIDVVIFEESLSFKISTKEELPRIISKLVEKNVQLYEIAINNKLEDNYLKLIQSKKSIL